MRHASIGRARDRVASSPTAWILLLAAYGAVVLVLLAPVLLASVSADDQYWILEKGPLNDGSIWHAFWTPLTQAFEFGTNPRGTALAVADRQVLALVAMKISVVFSIPPLIVWAMVKLTLFAASILAVRTFLRQLTFRGADGTIRGLAPGSIAFITIALPVTIAIGVKSQNLGPFNGWNHYPTLTWGTFTGYFLFAALVLKLSNLLQRNSRAWAIPVVLLMIGSGLALNLAYEMLALVLPISLLVLLLQPSPLDRTPWQRWRPKLVVFAPLTISYTALFIYIRYLLSQRDCVDLGSCYEGTVLEVRPSTLWNNFIGAMPGNNGEFVTEQAKANNLPFPGLSLTSITLAVLAVALMWAAWAAWTARHREARDQPGQDPDTTSDDHRGLVSVLILALCVAVGSSVITAINARAVDEIQTPVIPYRNGVVTWSALALALVVVVLLLLRARPKPSAWAGFAALTVVVAVSIAMYFPRNVMSAQVNREVETTRYSDGLQLEVTMGNDGPTADARRCQLIQGELERLNMKPTRPFGRATDAAYQAFEFYHGHTFCSTGLGRTTQ